MEYQDRKCEDCGLEWTIKKSHIKRKYNKCSKCVSKLRIIHDTDDKKRLSFVYAAMKDRCYNENNDRYYMYGGRGISICPEWLNSSDKFIQWSLSNGYKKGLQLDKDILSKKLGINPPVYSPETCMFITPQKNQSCKTSSRYITHNGETKTITEWCLVLGMEFKTLQYRLQLGWSDEKAITTPVGAIQPGAKRICQIEKNTQEVINTFSSAREADRKTNISFSGISNVLRGKNKTAGGFMWRYENSKEGGVTNE